MGFSVFVGIHSSFSTVKNHTKWTNGNAVLFAGVSGMPYIANYSEFLFHFLIDEIHD